MRILFVCIIAIWVFLSIGGYYIKTFYPDEKTRLIIIYEEPDIEIMYNVADLQVVMQLIKTGNDIRAVGINGHMPPKLVQHLDQSFAAANFNLHLRTDKYCYSEYNYNEMMDAGISLQAADSMLFADSAAFTLIVGLILISLINNW